ncbi:hypothetical protein ACRUZW_25970 [Mycobacterium colombiense]
MTAPWMRPLDEKTRETVRRNVAQAPPLTQRQREKLRLLFRAKPDSTAESGAV